eukprot:TRINITY_DN14363_c1_g1_i1.p1 TRINITY_DN14363_c1_g1~~TRINITY_DN14363_c1_g1_i1.p1  ORF type:complete len:516 (+),score=192.47 TRINITY_DN14363_c1_g1_i1:71-1549(+)
MGPAEKVDVVVVGAGISGVCIGYHLKQQCPDASYVVLERRDCIGGTWDLFRYPGIRSDSDMFTLGFPFRPWNKATAIADGTSIREYVQDTAREYGVDKRIRYGVHVVGAAFSTAAAEWEVRGRTADGEMRIRCSYLFMAAGYYDYDEGYTPQWKGLEAYRGRVIHPQQWPRGEDCAGQKVVVIGSGATAITLVPTLAQTAAHVTMLQRSPSYLLNRPSSDALFPFLSLFGTGPAYAVTWLRNVALTTLFYNLCLAFPNAFAKLLKMDVQRRANLTDAEIKEHFSPHYKPWDQRLCLVPDNDFFDELKKGRVSIVTDHIDCFTEKGIRLRSGKELEADAVVTATGLNLKLLGGLEFTVDGEKMDLTAKFIYKGTMVQDLPNLSFSLGYINASWTLRANLVCEWAARVVRHMRQQRYATVCPRLKDSKVLSGTGSMLPLSSGYVQRAQGILPRSSETQPWSVHQNYFRDMAALRLSRLEDGVLEFTKAPPRPKL